MKHFRHFFLPCLLFVRLFCRLFNVVVMLEQLIKSYPEVTRAHVLSKIDPTSLLLLRRCSRCVQQFVDRNSSSLTSFSPESSSSVALSTTQNHKFKPSEFASSINLIEYAIGCGCPIDRTRFATFAARFGNIDVIRYLVEEKDLCEWDWRTTQKACEFGHVELLKWLLEKGCPINDFASIAAAQNGRVNVLEFLEERDIVKPGRWSPRALARACRNLHLNAIDFLLQRGCQWDDDCLFEEVLVGAALTKGRLDALEWILEKEVCETTDFWPQHCEYAARLGHLDCLRWLREVPKTKWDREQVIRLCREAGTDGSLKCLEYVMQSEEGENEVRRELD